MSEINKKHINLQLLLPISLLILQAIVITGLIITGFEITPFLLTFFIILSLFLVYRITPQLLVIWRVKQAIKNIKTAENLAEDGKPMQAIKIMKISLLNLPKDNYLEALEMMRQTYQEQNMTEAVKQVNAIQSKSAGFFEKIAIAKQPTDRDQRDWQVRAFQLQKMINALPVTEGPELSDAETNQ